MSRTWQKHNRLIPIHHDACQAGLIRDGSHSFFSCLATVLPNPYLSQARKPLNGKPCLAVPLLHIPWHNESGILPVGNAASDSVTSASLRYMPHHNPPFLAAADQYGKGFYQNQSGLHTDRNGFACKKISVDSSSIAAKKGGTKQDMTGSGRSWVPRFTLQQT